MWKDGGSAPSAPDPVATANAQGVANKEAARLTTQLNRYNQLTPYGNLTWKQGSEAPSFDQTGYDNAMAEYKKALDSYNTSPGNSGGNSGLIGNPFNPWNSQAPQRGPAPVAPDASAFWNQSGNPDQWTSTTTLDPRVQSLVDSQLAISNALSGTSADALKRVGSSLGSPMDTTGLSDWGDVPATPNFTPITAQQPQASSASAGSPVTLSADGLTALPEVSDATRQRVEEALYQRATSRLDPQWQQNQGNLDSQLASQGITQGSAAYQTAQDNLSRQRNDAYTSARDSAIANGGLEQSRLFNLALQPRQQQFSERQAIAGVNTSNADRAAQISTANANLAAANAQANAARDMQAQIAQQQQQQQAWQDAMSGAGLSDSQRAQQLAEALQLRQQPLSELNALRTGSMPTQPNFQGQGGGANVAAAPVAQSVYNSYQGALNDYNAQQSSNNSFLGGLFSLGSSALMSPVGTFKFLGA